MNSQALAPRVFYSACDDTPESFDVLQVKLQEVRKTLTEQVARLAFVQEPIQWKTATDYTVLTTQLIDIEAKVQGVFARLCSSWAIAGHIALLDKPEAVLGLIQEEKRLELELALTLDKIKRLKRLCESKQLRESKFLDKKPENVSRPGAPNPDLTRFSGYNASYSFWKSVPYTVQAAYSAPAIMGGGYYRATGRLGTELETRVGQKLHAILEHLEERISRFCSWRLDDAFERELGSYQDCLDALYKTFTDLFATVETIEQDVLTKTICDYAYGLEYAFSQARSLLDLLRSCMQKPARQVLEAINDVGELYQPDSGGRGEFEKVSLLYASLQKVVQANSERSTSESKNIFDKFLCGLLDVVQNVHAAIDPVLLRPNQEEAKVFDRLLTAHKIDASVMSYLAKRMVSALYFPMQEQLDIELELALHICTGFTFGDEAFSRICEAYEQAYSSRRIHTPEEYAQAVAIAGRIAHMRTMSQPLMHYYECCQIYAEFCERIGHKKSKAFRPVLAAALERAATAHGLTAIFDKDVQVGSQFLGRQAARALFASNNQERLAGYRSISAVIEDARYENALLDLQPDVCQMLHKTSIQKLCAFFYNSPKKLGIREIRLFNPLATNNSFRLDSQMAVYKLIKNEHERGGAKPLSDLFKERYSESQFARWYTSFDDLYRKNVLTQYGNGVKGFSMQPIATDEAVRQIACAAVGSEVASVEDRAIWEAVVAKQQTPLLAGKLEAYLLKCIPAVLAKNTLDVSLELLLFSIKSDRVDRTLYDACKANKVLFECMKQYDRVFQHNRSDILLKEALDVLQPVLRMQNGQFDILAYASSWQKCIEYARKLGLEGVDKEQHAKLSQLLYAKLDALSTKPGAIHLTGSHRYCMLTSNQFLSGTNEGMLFRLLACCLFASDPAERQQAQHQVTTLVEMQHAYKSVSQGVMSLLYENTTDKIIKGGFDIGSTERDLFITGPLTECIRKEQDELGDTKLNHALFFLIRKERLAANGLQPVLDMFLQAKGRAAFEAWYQQYQQFLVSGPAAQSASLFTDNPEAADWKALLAFSKCLTEGWES